MPIYAYKCASCGFAKDMLQKISEAPLSQCPSCGAPSFQKQLTAAGFQLKGSGWYATDFKGGGTAAPPSGGELSGSGESGKEAKTHTTPTDKSDSKPDGKSESRKADAPATKKSDATPAAGSGT